MKKFLIVLLSLGLIAAFSMTASAADVKFSGSYYVVGVYDNNDALADNDLAPSRAFFFQRVRLEPVFQIAEGLTFTTRMDALEKQWGSLNWRTIGGGGQDSPSSRPSTGGAGSLAQENIEFERSNVTFKTAIGTFVVGYQGFFNWGTVFQDFSDNDNTTARILYINTVGPVTLLAFYDKFIEADTSAGLIGLTDADISNYALAGIYSFKNGNAGLLYYYFNIATPRPGGLRINWHYLAPYVKATFGPVYVESEVIYMTGKTKFEAPLAGVADVDTNAWSAYLLAKANLGPAHVGAQVGWVSGDDGSDPTKNDASLNTGTGWNPALILMNDDLNNWKGRTGANTANSGKGNILLYNIFGGFNPTPKINVESALTYAEVDKIPAAAAVNKNESKKLGIELDITASYKIYDNLTYMVGAGYLWTGDAFKGYGAGSNANVVGNDYLLMNKLSLSF
ncbi:MAG: hypothetical protein A2V87_08090 [Deltaproteobacteria bacterium RBG_16_58_17]|nr:MAG: hypothetical protein A2V87_08090 [Deltaproteobacteria bacterium RBG_16_58_17]OHE19047.1 MAG: hypothetical protein A2X96_07110 [Syntrophobacterales bacterium GWC2_56_13]OHE20440.1 MAG: hypothetical protein A2X95_04275 [Syntrophobacterales bacterium GWF2_56_9]